jgi:ubiquinone/menaquinone biosynthesis C-methylase UbiE
MNHQDHVNLLRGGVEEGGRNWADLGSGSGAFTLALADLLGGDGEIHSVDRNAGGLREQEHAIQTRFPKVRVHYLTADFTKPLDLPPLDGIVMANSLRFQRDQARVVQSVKAYLRPGGRFVLVEYNADQGNPWVPHPLSYDTWQALAHRCGFVTTRLLARRPSSFMTEIYSALSC